MTRLWILIALAGCAVAAPAPVQVRAESRAIALEDWTSEVAAAVERWKVAGCAIEFADAGVPIVAVWERDWTQPTQYLGVTTPQGAFVVADLDAGRRLQIATHELGHVLGLEHSDHGVMVARPIAGVDELPTAEDCSP